MKKQIVENTLTLETPDGIRMFIYWQYLKSDKSTLMTTLVANPIKKEESPKGDAVREQIILNNAERLAKVERTLDANSLVFQRFINLVKTRVDSFESLFGSRFGLLKLLFWSVFKPTKIEELFKKEHLKVLESFTKKN